MQIQKLNIKRNAWKSKIAHNRMSNIPINKKKAQKRIALKVKKINKAKRRAILGVLRSIEQKAVYLSEIIVLGYLLKVILLLADPACRPISDENKIKLTRSGKEYDLGEVHDSYYAVDPSNYRMDSQSYDLSALPSMPSPSRPPRALSRGNRFRIPIIPG